MKVCHHVAENRPITWHDLATLRHPRALSARGLQSRPDKCAGFGSIVVYRPINPHENLSKACRPKGLDAAAINLRIGPGGLIDVSPAATKKRGRPFYFCGGLGRAFSVLAICRAAAASIFSLCKTAHPCYSHLMNREAEHTSRPDRGQWNHKWTGWKSRREANSLFGRYSARRKS